MHSLKSQNNQFNFKFIFPIIGFKEKFFLSLIKKKETILDYGCGEGIWSKIQNKKIYLYDSNKYLYKILKKKYQNNHNIYILKKKIFNQEVVLMNSVIQYIDNRNFSLLIKKFIKNNFKTIIISDIPKYPRILEFLLLLFFFKKEALIKLSFIFNKSYRNTNFFLRNKEYIINLFPGYNYKVLKNLNNNSIVNGRYTLMFNKK
jgi:hypothetical protein